jgi:hypothetical protein
MKNVKECKPDYGQTSGGDACCAPQESPEQELKGYLPKLNEIIFDLISEDPNIATG